MSAEAENEVSGMRERVERLTADLIAWLHERRVHPCACCMAAVFVACAAAAESTMPRDVFLRAVAWQYDKMQSGARDAERSAPKPD